MSREYEVTRTRSDSREDVWYIHEKGYPGIPIFGSFFGKKADAVQFAVQISGKKPKDGGCYYPSANRVT